MNFINIFVRHIFILIIIWLSLSVPNLAQSKVSNPDIASKIDEYMTAFVGARGFGGSVLVAREGKMIVSNGYGMANIELSVPNTPQTVFRIGSLTKQFTSAAIMLLRERGKLNLQDSVCRYSAECPAMWREVTIHHLLTHTSGIPNVTALADWESKKTLPSSPQQTIARVRNLPLEFKPGERFNYSNSNYLILGLVIEKASGQTYEAFLKENIFAPLQMTNTGYEHPERIVPNRAAGYSRNGETIVNAAYVDMSLPYSAGALYSTVEDLLRWDQALYSEKFLSSKSLAAMFTPFKNGYAYGWGISTLFNRRYIAHTGGIEGFSTHITRFPDERATVIFLSNSETAVANVVANDLAAILFGEKYEIPKGKKEIAVNAKIYETYAGQYELAPNFIFTVTVENGKLMVQATGQPSAELFPESETQFFLRVVDAQITFVKDAKGAVTGLILRQNGQNVPAKKIK